MFAVVARRSAVNVGRVGALLGLAVGSLSTLLLHVGLARVAGDGGVGMAREGLLIGIPAGLIVGWNCGTLLRGSVQPPHEPADSAARDGEA